MLRLTLQNFLGLGVVLIILVLSGPKSQGSGVAADTLPPFHIERDWMDTRIYISVPYDITEPELRAILSRVADDRQDDPKRNYLMLDSLVVKAYLKKGKLYSVADAGQIVRWLPRGGPKERKKIDPARRRLNDGYCVGLEGARRFLTENPEWLAPKSRKE